MDKPQIIQQLAAIQHTITSKIEALSADQFTRQPKTEWSAADYFKHLILSVKPFAKGLSLSKPQLVELFGVAERASRSYEELTQLYRERLEGGVRAEDYAVVTPIHYRFPEGVTDQQHYLVETWQKAHTQLFSALDIWSEEDLDHYQLMHPAINLLTVREMLYFTIYHNQHHSEDIHRITA